MEVIDMSDPTSTNTTAEAAVEIDEGLRSLYDEFLEEKRIDVEGRLEKSIDAWTKFLGAYGGDFEEFTLEDWVKRGNGSLINFLSTVKNTLFAIPSQYPHLFYLRSDPDDENKYKIHKGNDKSGKSIEANKAEKEFASIKEKIKNVINEANKFEDDIKNDNSETAKDTFCSKLDNFEEKSRLVNNVTRGIVLFQLFYNLWNVFYHGSETDKDESIKAAMKNYTQFCFVTTDSELNDEELCFLKEKEKSTGFFTKSHNVLDTVRKSLYGEDVYPEDPVELALLSMFIWDIAKPSKKLGLDTFRNTNIILSGAPGTGKTFTVSKQINKLRTRNNDLYKESKMIQFHPSYTYQDFIEGIKPVGMTSDGSLNLKPVNGSFKQFCIDVCRKNENDWKTLNKNGNNPPDKDKPGTLKEWPHYYFVVDEINRGNLSAIFGETFTLLESDYRDYDFSGKDNGYTEGEKTNNSDSALIETALSNVIKSLPEVTEAEREYKDSLIYKKVKKSDNENDYDIKFGIPFNIHFIGMMNDVDRSIDSFDLAFRRRFRWEPMYCEYKVIYNTLMNIDQFSDKEGSHCPVLQYVKSCMALNYYITGYSYEEMKKEFNPEKDVIDTDTYKTAASKAKGNITVDYLLKIKEGDDESERLGRTYEIGHGIFLKIRNIIGKKKIYKPDTFTSIKSELFDNYIAGTIKEYLRQKENDDAELDRMVNKARDIFVKQNEVLEPKDE